MEEMVHIRVVLEIDIILKKVQKILTLLNKVLTRHHVDFTLEFELVKDENEKSKEDSA